MAEQSAFQSLIELVSGIPSVNRPVSSGFAEQGHWWLKFSIDIDHPLAWNVIQELGHVLNFLSLEEKLPTVFMPVSPRPYENGGPRNFLSWVIECKDKNFTPTDCAEWLEGRLPRPVEDPTQWSVEEPEDPDLDDEDESGLLT
ncbi:MAG TPA: hypothetical protein VKW06_01945 [Candidatus Angelobacter sp.]|nr:hypothetical protein [Candidatus Angelobacter sp.]